MSVLYTLPHNDWKTVSDKSAVQCLEQGKVIYFPQLAFTLLDNEKKLLSAEYSQANIKNISFNPLTGKVKGLKQENHSAHVAFEQLLNRYYQVTHQFIKTLLPTYTDSLQIGRTSYRPVEIQGRKAPSYRKDDTRLHVDAFPANPNQGKRILRIFSNINPVGKARHWRIGTPFENVAAEFLPQVSHPSYLSRYFLKLLKITKSERTAYDSIMLNIHNRMKKSMDYQKSVAYAEIDFPADSTWIVYTDSVSHAALSGQYALEQTFYLPVTAMSNENLSPLRILEKMAGKKLA